MREGNNKIATEDVGLRFVGSINVLKQELRKIAGKCRKHTGK